MSDAITLEKKVLLPEQIEEQELHNRITELSQKGYQLLKENLVERASQSFSEILAIEPSNNYALVGLGDVYRKERRYQEAISHYQKCLTYHQGNNYALFGLADCYKALKQFNRAIEIWEEYLHHDDKNITVLTRIADAYRKVRDFKKSQELYNRVLEMEENNSYALIGLGHLNYDFKEYEKALSYWMRMLELSRSRIDIRVLTSIGNCHRKMKTFGEGVSFFKMALDIQSNNFYALFGLADCYRGMNQQNKSLIYWNKILDNDKKNKVILTRAGDAYRQMGDLESAENYYNDALNIEYDHYAIMGLALVNKDKGKLNEAVDSLCELITYEPKNCRFCIECAQCYGAMGKKDKAIEVLSDYLKLGFHNSFVIDEIDRLRAGA